MRRSFNPPTTGRIAKKGGRESNPWCFFLKKKLHPGKNPRLRHLQNTKGLPFIGKKEFGKGDKKEEEAKPG